MLLLLRPHASVATAGSASLTVTAGVSSSGTPKAYGASSSTFTFGVSSSGTSTSHAFGSASMTVTFGVDSTPGTITARGAASLEIVAGITSRPKGLRLVSLSDTTLILTPNDENSLSLTPLQEQQS